MSCPVTGTAALSIDATSAADETAMPKPASVIGSVDSGWLLVRARCTGSCCAIIGTD